MEWDPNALSIGSLYSLMIRAITPRPIAWVSTLSPAGISNLAPFSYFAGVGSNPPALFISIANRPDGSKKDSLRNIEASGEWVVNVVPYGLRESMVRTADELPYECSEFAHTGLSEVPSQRVRPPGVREAPIQLECQLLEIVRIGQGASAANSVFGQIVWIRIADHVLTNEGKLDPERVDTIGRLGGLSYCRTTDRFDLR